MNEKPLELLPEISALIDHWTSISVRRVNGEAADFVEKYHPTGKKCGACNSSKNTMLIKHNAGALADRTVDIVNTVYIDCMVKMEYDFRDPM